MSDKIKTLEEKYSLIKENDKEDVLAGLEELEQLNGLRQSKVNEWIENVNSVAAALSKLHQLTKDRVLIDYFNELQNKIENEGEETVTRDEERFYYLATGIDELLQDEIRSRSISFIE